MMIDNTVHHETPEGIQLSLTPASVVPRAGAWFIDMLIRRVISLVAFFVFVWFGQSGIGVILIVMFLVDWFYAVYFEVFRDGQTIGKKHYGIMVVMDSGMPIGWQASMIRNLLRVADALPFGYFIGVVSTLVSTQNKRLGDIAAGTLVVYVPQIKANFDIKPASSTTSPIPLTMKEQQAILAFAERMDELPQDRSDELVELLSGLTGVQGKAGAKSILGYANAIIGRTAPATNQHFHNQNQPQSSYNQHPKSQNPQDTSHNNWEHNL